MTKLLIQFIFAFFKNKRTQT